MPIRTTCPTCSKTYNLGDDMAGKRVKCPCGASMAVPGATASAAPAAARPVAAASTPQAAKTAATSARPAAPAARTGSAVAPPAMPPRSIFDELTENDFNRPQFAVPTAAQVDYRKESKALNRLAGADPDVAKAEAESKGWFIFLGVVHIIWAVIYCALSALFILASAALAMVEDSLPILRLGLAAVLVVTSFMAIFSGATGVGILMVKPWGWWLGVFSMFWGIFDRISNLAQSLIQAAQDGAYATGQYVGMAVGIIGCISFLQLFCTARNRKAFGVKTPTLTALLICGFSALVMVGIITALVYMIPDAVDEEVAFQAANVLI